MEIPFTNEEILQLQKKDKSFKLQFKLNRTRQGTQISEKVLYDMFRDVSKDLKDCGFTNFELTHYVQVVSESYYYQRSLLHFNITNDLKMTVMGFDLIQGFSYQVNWKPVLNELKYIDNQDVLAIRSAPMPNRYEFSASNVIVWAAYFEQSYLILKDISRKNSFVIDEFLNKIINENVHWDKDAKSGEIEKDGIVYSFKIHPTYVEEWITIKPENKTLEYFKQLTVKK